MRQLAHARSSVSPRRKFAKQRLSAPSSLRCEQSGTSTEAAPQPVAASAGLAGPQDRPASWSIYTQSLGASEAPAVTGSRITNASSLAGGSSRRSRGAWSRSGAADRLLGPAPAPATTARAGRAGLLERLPLACASSPRLSCAPRPPKTLPKTPYASLPAAPASAPPLARAAPTRRCRVCAWVKPYGDDKALAGT